MVDGGSDDVLGQLAAITAGGAHHSIDTTGVPAVMLTALQCLQLGGSCGFVGAQTGDVQLDALSIIGKTVIGVLEGSADPQTFIPRMIDLWQAGRFPFDRLIESFPLDQINEGEEASLTGRVVKPVLLPG